MGLRRARIVAVTFIALILISCGQANSDTLNSTSPHNNAKILKNPTSVPLPTPTPILVNPEAEPSQLSFNIEQQTIQLHIDAGEGLYCNYGDSEALDPGGPLEILLRDNPSVYTTSEINQMTDFVNNWFQIHPQVLPLPAGLQIPTPSVGETPFNGIHPQTGCSGDIQLTNTGNTALQIQLLDVRLTATPQVDTNLYRFIDFCSFRTNHDSPVPCPFQRAGGQTFAYTYNLTGGVTGQVVSPQTNIDPGSNSIQLGTSFTLMPNQPVDISINFASTPANMIYSIVPELTIDTGMGEQTVTLTQLASTLSFVNPDQISCYGVQDNAIVPVTPSVGFSHLCV